MRFVVCNDLHLKPAGDGYDVDAMGVPSDADAALLLGDVTHRAGREDVELARRVVRRFHEALPVVYVPGNHDPSPMDQRVVGSLSAARSGHREVHDLSGLTVVGWGCEQRTLSQPIDQCEFDELDVRDSPRGDRRYAADRTADDLEAACHAFVCGGASAAAVADDLGIRRSERAQFERGLETIERTYEDLAALLAGRTDVLLASHVPPFNTAFDRHHAVGSRERDRESLHVGSIAIKLAVREHDVFAALSGHSHTFGYETGDGRDGRPHYLNLGYRGVGTVAVDPERGAFRFERAATGAD